MRETDGVGQSERGRARRKGWEKCLGVSSINFY